MIATPTLIPEPTPAATAAEAEAPAPAAEVQETPIQSPAQPPEGGGATSIEISSPIRFFWAGEEIEGAELWVKPGALTLKVMCPAGPTEIIWIRPSGEMLSRQYAEASPPLIIKLPELEIGDHRLVVRVGELQSELRIRVLEVKQ